MNLNRYKIVKTRSEIFYVDAEDEVEALQNLNRGLDKFNPNQIYPDAEGSILEITKISE